VSVSLEAIKTGAIIIVVLEKKEKNNVLRQMGN
jgi:hypothetical protein